MKIAIFYNLQPSGAKRVVFEHTKWLKRLGHTVDIYTIKHEDNFFDPPGDNEYTYNYNPTTISLPVIKRISEDLSMLIKLKNLHQKIANDIDARGYDVALIHTDKLTQAPFILNFLKTKNFYFCLEPLRIAYEYSLRISEDLSPWNKIYEYLNRTTRKVIDRANARASQNSLSISYFGRELMIQAFDLYPQVSYLGIDKSIFRPINISKKNKILFIGQKLGLNGYDFALKSMDLIPKNIRPELKIISWSSNRKERLTDQELVKEYNESLFTLSLSTLDTFGLVPLESLACATPVIAFNVAGYRETILDKKTGFLVEFDPNNIAEKAIFLIKNPQMAKKMGEIGEKWVKENWSWEKQIKILESYLKK